ncbi:MAG: hypothetical protein SFW67_03440 [Myxococcaceae bacterium]|nr:hypothetical protein [Myxococcaceae bacterium]
MDLSSVLETSFTGCSNDGSSGQLRNFNWQCRAALATPFTLQ